MRTILMALVLGLCCTNFAFAQPEVIKYDVDPPAPVVLESVVQEATPNSRRHLSSRSGRRTSCRDSCLCWQRLPSSTKNSQ